MERYKLKIILRIICNSKRKSQNCKTLTPYYKFILPVVRNKQLKEEKVTITETSFYN